MRPDGQELSIQEPPLTLPEQAPARRRSGGWMRVAAAVLALAALYWVGREAGAQVPRFAAWVDTLGIWGPLVFIAGYTVATVAFVPGVALTLAAGVVFGIAEGVAIVFVGATLGATAAFLVARYAARDWVERRLEGNERFAAIDRAVGREGLKIVTLLRLSPVFPFNLLNYALGLTHVRLSHYVIGCLGMLPATLLYVYSGKLLGDVVAVAGGARVARGPGYWVVLALGLIATVVVTALVTRVARRALSEEVEEIEDD